MMDADELEQLCLGIRAKTVVVDRELVSRIEADAEEYRRLRDELLTPEPPEGVASMLWFFGWLVYEASWMLTLRVRPGFESHPDEDVRTSSIEDADLVMHLYDAAIMLGWPELAPRALGAVRSAALVASKRDTLRGYDDAWQLHRECRVKYDTYAENLAGRDPAYLLALRETQLQMLLAETGTACRTSERVLTFWGDDEADPGDERRQLQDIVRDVTVGAERGSEALELVATIDDAHGLVDSVDGNRMALATAYRNPGIMTARALLLLLPITFMLERQKRIPAGEHTSWADVRMEYLARFEKAYRAIETEVRRADGTQWALLAEHARSVAQLRLNLALLAPGYSLPSWLTIAPCLEIDPLGPDAVEALSAWLAETGENGRQRGDAGVIGSVTMPGYIREIGEMRRSFGATLDGYVAWLRRWRCLDRFPDLPGRWERIERMLREFDDPEDETPSS